MQPTPARGAWARRDLARSARGSATRSLRPVTLLIVAALASGLALAALRIDILRARYALAESALEEKTLLEQRREWTARVRALRDPARLASLAGKRGLGPPERVVELAPEAEDHR
jgi:hypothetical protein